MNLDFFVKQLNPVLIFLSEPQIFQCDVAPVFSSFSGSFSYHLNSDDVFCPDLPLITRKAKGGTMAMWRASLDPYIKPLPTTSSSVLPLLLTIPGLATTAHIGVYLPTSGQDAEFLSALSELETVIQDISENFACPIYIRGDFNVNPRNKSRTDLFDLFLQKYNLSSIVFGHNSHHHFIGEGKSDCQLDLLLYCGPPAQAEVLASLVCGQDNPLVNSHHDIVFSSFPLPKCRVEPSSGDLVAPRISNNRVRILWSDDIFQSYETTVSPLLASLRQRWGDSSGPSCTSILLSATNDALSSAAQATNRFVKLGKATTSRPTNHPQVREAQLAALATARSLRRVTSNPQAGPAAILQARESHRKAKATLQSVTRSVAAVCSKARDEKLFSICSRDPTSIFKSLRALKSSSSSKIKKLTVANKVYEGINVPDGFYDSLKSLKCPDMTSIHTSSSYQRFGLDYNMIIDICHAGIRIPPVSGIRATEILYKLKADVNDLYSITARHYLNAGMEGTKHFLFLMNHIISDVNLSSLDILNSVWAIILFKGHGKDRESDRSYRFISTCPLLSKALDIYVGGLCESGWAAAQASTQFQGPGSCHELAALLLTETIQYSMFELKLPLYVLYLDAKSAFDLILRELCIRGAYLAAIKNGETPGQEILYLNNRLEYRLTFAEYNKVIMGPISDHLGVEQGGFNSGNEYNLANSPELTVTQQSMLGVIMGSVHVASIGQADDLAFTSNTIDGIQGLLYLAMELANKHHNVKVPEKTKLLCYTPRGQGPHTRYWMDVAPLQMSGKTVPFVDQAEHVGILRSTKAGNLASIMNRTTAHHRAIYSVLPAGLARGHHGSPAAALHVEQMYGLPVLLSGLASLVLSKTEQDTLDLHHKRHLEQLQKLYPCTPAPVVYFLAGSLPASAKLHMRQLGLLGMVARLGPESILFQHGSYMLARPSPSSSSFKSSWFAQVRDWCDRYGLPDPLFVLYQPETKARWKATIRRQVLQYWLARLRDHAGGLSSLDMFRASHMSLTRPSVIWTSCGSSTFEVQKATVQARMLSGRYRTCWLRRHWSGDQTGACRVPGCTVDTPGTLLHLATGQCPGLAPATARAAGHWQSFLHYHPALLPLIQVYSVGSPEEFLKFLLDPSTQPGVITLAQEQGHEVVGQACYLARTWLYTLHRARLEGLGLWEK
jgi:hypothetical protein